jgi:adenylate cyclase
MAEAAAGAAPAAPGDYEIRFEPCAKRVRAEFNGTWIADSSRALVVHETRAAPAYYFPREDVRMEFLQPTALHTHCPFKGNASYWTLSVAGQEAGNAAWSYEEPYRDAEPIRGYLSFYPDRIAALYEGDEEVAFMAPPASMHANPLAGWLLAQAWKAASTEALAEGFFAFLRESGCPIARATIIIPTLHPQIFATVLVWREDATEIRVIFEPHDILRQPKFADSPFAPIMRGAGGVRRHLEDPDVKLDFPVVRDLHAEGATDYVAMPFRFSDGQINVMSMTSFTPGGFSTAHLGRIYEVLPGLARLFEVHAVRRTAVALLETYLGQQTGKRVLEGLVKHGDGEHIHAVIWFCDFRDSTALSESMDRETYLLHLNRFFHCMAGAVIDGGGEVLRFIGDAVLAIFPIAESVSAQRTTATGTLEACRRAVKAVRAAAERIEASNAAHRDLPPLRYGIGLHLGDVTYGNIGVPRRLEFTVIGSAANEAARVESMTKELKRTVLVSSAFADKYPGKLVSVGRHALKGLEGERELFTLPDA